MAPGIKPIFSGLIFLAYAHVLPALNLNSPAYYNLHSEQEATVASTDNMTQKIDKVYEEAISSGLLPGASLQAGDKDGMPYRIWRHFGRSSTTLSWTNVL